MNKWNGNDGIVNEIPLDIVNFTVLYVNVSNVLPYARNDEPFLQLVNRTYPDDELHEWEPMSPVPGKPGEPGYMGMAVLSKKFLQNSFISIMSR